MEKVLDTIEETERIFQSTNAILIQKLSIQLLMRAKLRKINRKFLKISHELRIISRDEERNKIFN